MSITAMKQALEVMGLMGADLICEAAHHKKKDLHEIGEPCPIQQRWHKAFDALRNAIAEAEKQEPVAWCVLEPWLSGKFEAQDCFSDVALDANVGWVPLYTAPPAAQRQWVGLTDEEIDAIKPFADGYEHREYARAIEAKLKEKNT